MLTRGGGVVPVLHKLDRVVPARGSLAPVRLRAPYFGLLDDVIVAPEQRLVIDGSEVEYLFNQEAVLVPARHLVNGFAAMAESASPNRALHTGDPARARAPDGGRDGAGKSLYRAITTQTGLVGGNPAAGSGPQ